MEENEIIEEGKTVEEIELTEEMEEELTNGKGDDNE